MAEIKRQVAVVCLLEGFRAFQRLMDCIESMDSRTIETGGTEYRHVCEVFDVEGRQFDDVLFLHKWYETKVMRHMTAEQFRQVCVRGRLEA